MSGITPTKSKLQIWRERVEAQGRSGKTVRVFCGERRLKQHAFFYWRKKIRDLPGRFIPVARALPWAEKSPRIHLPNGVQIELGAGLESGAVHQFLRGLCGVGYPMLGGDDSSAPRRGYRAKS